MTFAGTMNDDSSFGLTPFDFVFAASLPIAKPPSGLVQLWEQGFAGQVLGLVPLTPTLVTLPVRTERSRFRETVALTQYLLGLDHSETLASRR